MIKFFLFLTGFGLTLIGSMYIIIYLNLMTFGYNFSDYVNFIIRRIECWNFIIGIIIMFVVIMKGLKDELYIRHIFKF